MPYSGNMSNANIFLSAGKSNKYGTNASILCSKDRNTKFRKTAKKKSKK